MPCMLKPVTLYVDLYEFYIIQAKAYDGDCYKTCH